MIQLILFSLFVFVIVITILTQRLYVKRAKDLEDRNKRLTALRKMDEIMMSSTTDFLEVAQRVTDTISFELGFELGVLTIIDRQKNVLRRVAMSRTPTAVKEKQVLSIPYEKIEIPLNYDKNLLVQVVKTGQERITHNLHDVFMPVLSYETTSRIQATVGIKTSFIYPLKARGRVLGAMVISVARFENEVSVYEKESIENLVEFVGVALDNTLLYQDLRVASKKLEEANIRLQDVDRLKDDFVSIASHELRTPMTAIRSYAWMALNRSDIPLSEKLKKYLTRTYLSTERLISLVNDMLNISRIESGRVKITPVVFDIQVLVAEIASEVFAKAQEKNLSFILEHTQVPRVFADEDKVHQILLNLIGNALKFTPEGGQIKISFFSDGQFVEVLVKDSGVGISQEDLPSLFKKFGRLETSYVATATSGGTGLGLYICKSLIELMGGKIWGVSEGLGKGATFTFSLPVASKETLTHPDKYSREVRGETKVLEPVSI